MQAHAASAGGDGQGTRTLGWIALALYAAHAAELLIRFPPQNLLWACNLASAAIAASLLRGAPLPLAAGTIMLTLGNVLWGIDIATGGELLPTAPLTHIVLWGVGLAGVRRLGVPRGAGPIAWLCMLAALGAARIAGPASENINLSHHVPRGWEAWFPSHAAYIGFNTVVLGLGALALEVTLRAWAGRERGAA